MSECSCRIKWRYATRDCLVTGDVRNGDYSVGPQQMGREWQWMINRSQCSLHSDQAIAAMIEKVVQERMAS